MWLNVTEYDWMWLNVTERNLVLIFSFNHDDFCDTLFTYELEQ